MASQPKLTAVPDFVSLASATLALAILTDTLTEVPGVDDVKLSYDAVRQRITIMLVMKAQAGIDVPMHMLAQGLHGYRFEAIDCKPYNHPTMRFRRVITAVVEDAA
jgi:hypothetical protein